MDDKKEISGRTDDESPPQTPKPISESDTEESASQGVKSEKNMSKLKTNNEVDGADEKMLANEGKAEDSKIDVAEAKFSLNADKQNGEAKLDIGDLKPAFVGMGKEELMKYANDPFWVRLRWILFVTFWLIWLAMLVGAIVIIVVSPKCAPPTPRTWWEIGPLTEVSLDVGSDELQKLKDNKIQGVIVSNPLDSYVDYNTSTELVDFLKIAKEKDINVIIGLNPVNSDTFFFQSASSQDEYKDYYIWADSKGTRDNDGGHIPPNNWLSPEKGDSAWSFSSKRQQFFYFPDGKPVLNFRNPKVIDQFSSALSKWKDSGVKGFRLTNVPYILVDENLRDWTIGSEPGHVHDEYNFYRHDMTMNVEGIGEILQKWRKIAKDVTDSGPFMLSEDLTSLDAYLVNETLTIDLPKHSNVFTNEHRVSTAAEIYKGVNSAFRILDNNWPIWNYKVETLGADVMNILIMLLPGSMLVDVDNKINSQLLDIRKVPSVMFGSCNRELLANDSVFAYQRVQAGNPGYLVACNPSDETVTANFNRMNNVSDEVTVQVLSENYNNFTEFELYTGLKVPANAFQMPPKSAAVLTYVPK